MWLWSKIAANNATADASINFREGQTPGSLNDSARAMMAAAAKYRDDISGSLQTSGTSTAYSVTTNEGFTSLIDGLTIAIRPHVTSGAAPTINVDSRGAKPLRASSGSALGTSILISGSVYRITYFAAADEWLLHDFFFNVYNVPLGGILPFLSTTPPNSNFALPYGQAIARNTYAGLFAMIGTTFGSGDGTTTFNLPDLRGRGIVGLDNMGGDAAGRVTTVGGGIDGTTLGANGGAQNKTLAQANLPAYTLPNTLALSNNTNIDQGDGTTGFAGGGGGSPNFLQYGTQTKVTIGLGGGVTSGGSGTALPIMPPTIVLPMLLRVI